MSFNMQQMGGLMKKMQEDIARIQAELEKAEIIGADPSGKVTCKVNGQRDVLEIKIDPGIVDPNDVEMLEDLVLFAVREAIGKSEKFSQERMGELTKGLPQIPGLQLPF
ncbi:MAG TPA: YbaB/EbfC family nucleoid-associated protein [bacterium]|nr:YbaB/EbfC family nucleoid-associated protein [bacterium]